MADWVLDTLLPRDITQLRLFHEEAVHREHFEAGETVFVSGDLGDKIFFLVKGEVTVERDGATLTTLRDGNVFGEAALISDLPRNATIRAATSVDAIAVSPESFQELLGHLPGLSETMQNIMKTRMERDVDLKQEMPSVNVSAQLKRGRGP